MILNLVYFLQQHSLTIILCCLVAVLPVYNWKGSEPSLLDRLIVALNYIWFGLFGFICLIVNAIKGGRISPFMQYHIFQSFFLVMLWILLGIFVEMITRILYCIPFVKNIIPFILTPFQMPVIHLFIWQLSVIQLFLWLVIIYLVLTSLRGMYSYVPWVSDIIKNNVRK